MLEKFLQRSCMSYSVAFISTIVLLTLSNIFMTFAWYGHLKFHNHPLYVFILISWAIAFFEYCFQVPANRIGYEYMSAVELKTLQEIITMVVFVIFSTFYLGESIRWNHYLGMIFLVIGAYAIFYNPPT